MRISLWEIPQLFFCIEVDIFWMWKEVLSIYRKIVVLWNKHWCFETAGQIYFMNYVIILGKKIIFVTELYKYSDENILSKAGLHTN